MRAERKDEAVRPAPTLDLDQWIASADPPAGLLAFDESADANVLSVFLDGAALQLLPLVRATNRGHLFSELAGLGEHLPTDQPGAEAVRALGIRLGRALRSMPTDGSVAPRRRAGHLALATRLLFDLISTQPVAVALDLRDHPEAAGLAAAFAGPWTDRGAVFLRGRGRPHSGRLLLLLSPRDAERARVPLPRVAPPGATRSSALVRFVVRNLDTVSEVLRAKLPEHARRCWSTIAAFARPVPRHALPPMMDLPSAQVEDALGLLDRHGLLLRCGDAVSVHRDLRAPDLDEEERGSIAVALAARFRYGRDPEAATDLIRLDPQRIVAEPALGCLVPEAMRRLRGMWRHDSALELGAALLAGANAGEGSAGPSETSGEISVELARTLVDLGRPSEAAEALAELPTNPIVGDSLRSALADLVDEAITGQVDVLITGLAEISDHLGPKLRSLILGQQHYGAARPEAALAVLSSASGATADLVRSRAWLLLGRFEEASRHLRSASSDDRLAIGSARVRGNLAVAYLGEGRYEEAARELRAVVSVFSEAAMELETAVGYSNLAIALEFLGRYAEAHEAFEESLARFAAQPAFHGRVRTALALADLDTKLGDAERARRGLLQAEEAARAHGPRDLEIDAALRLARLHLRERMLDAAEGHLNRIDDALEREGSVERRANGQILRAQISLLRHDAREAPGALNVLPVAPAEGVRTETLRTWRCTRAWGLLFSEPSAALMELDAVATEADAFGDRAASWECRLLRAAAQRRLGHEGAADRDLADARAQLDRIAADLPASWRDRYLQQPWLRTLERLASTPASRPPAGRNLARMRSARVPTRSTGRLIGTSPPLLEALAMAERFAASSAPVLVEGESGTGKELVAELIHAWSPRAHKPLVRVNAAAMADTLLLSELFGHERGAFTGADRRRPGKFEVAAGGTLFLDEIGDISPSAQAALLRVLQDGTFHRVGGTDLVKADVRVVVATNRDLEERVEQGLFRLDLYYRICSLRLRLPPLRARREDLPLLVDGLLAEMVPEGPVPDVEPEALVLLTQYHWPGNVRELRNTLERVRHLSEDGRITADLVRSFGPHPEKFRDRADRKVDGHPDIEDWEPGPGFSLKRAQRRVEIAFIRKALGSTDGNIAAAARLLGLSRPMLSRKVKEYGLK